MAEKCPVVRGLYVGSNIPAVCLETCEDLWDRACTETEGDHENYRIVGLDKSDCPHPSTEVLQDTLQPLTPGSPIRLYTIVDICVVCDTEVGETTFTFSCSNT
jgi:hypothetical protein